MGNALLWAAGVADEFAPEVMICAADDPNYIADVEQQITSAGLVGRVDIVDCSKDAPTVAQMSAYDAVFVWENGAYSCFGDPWMLGDNLADYADTGGGVLVATGQTCGGPQGRR